MAEYTENYNLSMPEQTDTQASFIEAYRQNMGIIDENMGGGGGGAEIEEMTQAEYDALPDTKLTDGVLRAIKDDYSPSDTKMVGLADCYSLSEKQVGCWTDGKPLYQKTYSGLSAVSDTTFHTIGVTISNVETLVNAQTTGRQANGRLSTQNPMVNIQTDGTIQTCEDVNGWAINSITLWYTKTTDAAGLGTWTPEGVPAHHYSTTEQVIGTWVDGKPLYEKTIKFPSSVTANPNTWTSTGITISNIKAIISAELFRNGALFFASSWTVGSGTEELKFQHYYNSSLPCDTNSYVIVRYIKTTD